MQPTDIIPGDCPVVEEGGYTGFEHNLFRIEIADVDSGEPCFKWSRFNGGIVARGIFDSINNKVDITANIQPVITSGMTGFYIEAVEFDPLVPGTDGLGCWKVTYGAKATLNNNNEIELVNPPLFGNIPSSSDTVFFRLWNDIRKISEFPAGGTPVELQDGIRLEFDVATSTNYSSGDYWTFQVRAGEIKNKSLLIDQQPPEGIHHFRVPLAILNWNAAKDINYKNNEIDDCRHIFYPITKLTDCCTFRVGDGINSFGNFISIQAAIDHLPKNGGEICLLPGEFTENIVIANRQNIKIHGCGYRTKIISTRPQGEFGTADPVIYIKNSQKIKIESLSIQADITGNGILIEEDTPSQQILRVQLTPVNNIYFNKLNITASKRSAIECHNGLNIKITNCKILMDDISGSWPGIFFIGDDSLIENNIIKVIPGQIPTAVINSSTANAGLGGIQIGGTSENVRVIII